VSVRGTAVIVDSSVVVEGGGVVEATVESFTRTQSGLGTCDAGYVWDETPFGGAGTGTFSVDGTHGIWDTAGDGYAEAALPMPVWPLPLDLTLSDMFFEEIDVGAADAVRFFFVDIGTPLELDITRGGMVTVSVGGSTDSYVAGVPFVAAGAHVNVRLVVQMVDATQYYAEAFVWLTGETEPAAPNLSPAVATLPTQELEQLYLTLFANDTRAAFHISGIGTIGAPTILDNFNRSTSGGWGTASSGVATWSFSDASLSVDGTRGRATSWGVGNSLPLPFVPNDIQWTAQHSSPITNGHYDYYIGGADSLDVQVGTTTVYLLGDTTVSVAHGLSFASPYNIRVRQEGNTAKLKCWQGTEPTAWLLTTGKVMVTPYDRWQVIPRPNGAIDLYIDNLQIVNKEGDGGAGGGTTTEIVGPIGTGRRVRG